jgi:hypothetical protein
MTTDTTTPAASNGHMPDTPADPYAEHVAAQKAALEQQVASMRELVEGEQVIRDGLQRLLDESKAREKVVHRALDALLSQPGQKPTPKPQAKPQPGEWAVSDKKVAQVLDALIEHTANGEAISGNRLADVSPLSAEAIRRSLGVLRERGLARIAGASRGGGKLWLPMPEVIAERDASSGT